MKNFGKYLLLCSMILALVASACSRQKMLEKYRETNYIRFLGETEGISVAVDVLVNNSGDYILLGSGGSIFTEQLGIYLLNVTQYGEADPTNLISNRAFLTGWDMERGNDGNIVIAGDSTSPEGEIHRPFLLKCTENGTILWQHTYDFGLTSGFAFDVAVLDNQSFILSGQKIEQDGDTIPLLMKIGPNGESQWEKAYPAIGGRVFNEVLPSFNSGFIALSNFGDIGFSLLEVNANGDSLKLGKFDMRQFGASYRPGNFEKIAGGYLVAGTSASFEGGEWRAHIVVSSIDVDGNLVGHNQFFSDSTRLYLVNEMHATSDHGAVIVGAVSSDENVTAAQVGSIAEITEIPYKLFFMKIDENGNEVWSRRYGDDVTRIQGTDIAESPDGGYILLGNYDLENQDREMVVLIRTNEFGVIDNEN